MNGSQPFSAHRVVAHAKVIVNTELDVISKLPADVLTKERPEPAG